MSGANSTGHKSDVVAREATGTSSGPVKGSVKSKRSVNDGPTDDPVRDTISGRRHNTGRHVVSRTRSYVSGESDVSDNPGTDPSPWVFTGAGEGNPLSKHRLSSGGNWCVAQADSEKSLNKFLSTLINWADFNKMNFLEEYDRQDQIRPIGPSRDEARPTWNLTVFGSVQFLWKMGNFWSA